MIKQTVIYHSADYDGIFCREIARKFLPEAELIGWNFGDQKIPVPDGKFYILDLSPECLEDGASYAFDQCVWIDHHATAIAKCNPLISGYRIDGVAACRLAWQWFSNSFNMYGQIPNFGEPSFISMLNKKAFLDRLVQEPLAVRLAGEYDIWDKRDPRAEEFQFGLRGQDLHQSDWSLLLQTHGEGTRAAEILCDSGRRLQSYQQKIDADLVTHRSFRLKWEGLDFLCLNTGRFNSLTFAALDKPETGHDALLGFMWNGKVWTVSLYHANHRKELDLSAIAVKHGGGGHKGACGFTCKTLPL